MKKFLTFAFAIVALVAFFVGCTTTTGGGTSNSGPTLTVTLDTSAMTDHLQDRAGNADNSDDNPASLVATGYTPLLVGGIVSTADASADAACKGVFWGCYAIEMTNTTGTVWSVTVPEAYAQSTYWGADATQYTLKFVFVADSVLTGLTATSTDADVFPATPVSYVYADSGIGNAVITVANLGIVPVVPANYTGVTVTKKE